MKINSMKSNLVPPGATVLVLLSALVSAPLFAVADSLPPAASTVVGKQDPPLCTDEQYLKRIKTQYNGAEELRGNLKIKELTSVKQLHFGPSPHSVNQYANKTNYGTNSRYCQASATLSDGKSDTVYWRMDFMVNGGDHDINYDHCSLKHDTFQDKCADYIAGK